METGSVFRPRESGGVVESRVRVVVVALFTLRRFASLNIEPTVRASCCCRRDGLKRTFYFVTSLPSKKARSSIGAERDSGLMRPLSVLTPPGWMILPSDLFRPPPLW